MSHFNHESTVDMPSTPELDQLSMEFKKLHSELGDLSFYHRLYFHMFIMESVLDDWIELVAKGLPQMLKLLDSTGDSQLAVVFHSVFRALVEDFSTTVSMAKNSAKTLTHELFVDALGKDAVDAASNDAELADTIAAMTTRLHNLQVRFQDAVSNPDLDLAQHGVALRLRTQDSPADDELPPLESDA